MKPPLGNSFYQIVWLQDWKKSSINWRHRLHTHSMLFTLRYVQNIQRVFLSLSVYIYTDATSWVSHSAGKPHMSYWIFNHRELITPCRLTVHQPGFSLCLSNEWILLCSLNSWVTWDTNSRASRIASDDANVISADFKNLNKWLKRQSCGTFLFVFWILEQILILLLFDISSVSSQCLKEIFSTR